VQLIDRPHLLASDLPRLTNVPGLHDLIMLRPDGLPAASGGTAAERILNTMHHDDMALEEFISAQARWVAEPDPPEPNWIFASFALA